MDLPNFSTKDLVVNESFQRWILEHDDEARLFWDNWLATYPGEYQTVTDARIQVEALNRYFKNSACTDGSDLWQKICNSIEEADMETLQKSERL